MELSGLCFRVVGERFGKELAAIRDRPLVRSFRFCDGMLRAR